MKAKLLSFAFIYLATLHFKCNVAIYFYESSLFKWLRAKKLKIPPAA